MLAAPVKRLISIPISLLCSVLALAPVQVAAAPAKQPEPAPSEDEAPPDEDPNYTRAVEAYRLGTELYNDARFEEALAAFQEAATLYASPDFQFNIAKCYERLGKYEEAIRSYETYLRTAEDSGDTAVIEASIADLKRRIEERDAAAQKDPEPGPEPEPGPSNPGRKLVITGGVLLGVGAAVALGGGLGFGIPVSRDNATLGEVLDDNPDGLTFAQADEIANGARLNQTLELVMIGVGGALVVTGAALLGVGMAKNKKAKATTARLRVAPTWGRTGAGLSLSGSF